MNYTCNRPISIEQRNLTVQKKNHTENNNLILIETLKNKITIGGENKNLNLYLIY